MNTSFDINHAAVVALRSIIAQIFPTVLIGATEEEVEVSLASFSVVLFNQVTLCVSNDPESPALFLVMRSAGGPEHALPFETAFEDGCGVVEALTVPKLLEVLRQYGSVRSAPSGPASQERLH